MSSRHRNHILESISLRFVEESLPDHWVVHRYSADYGIDVQVEIFLEDGSRTGSRFYGQVKATDCEIGSDKLSLDSSHLEYWSRHSDPVALFRYFAKSNQLFWCWLNDVEWLKKPDSDTLDVSPYLIEWSDTESPTKIIDFLAKRKAIVSESFLPPYTISIASQPENTENDFRLSKLINNSIGTFPFNFLPEKICSGELAVNIRSSKFTVTIMGMPGVSFSHGQGIEDEDLIGLYILAIFLSACRYEKIIFARTLAELAAPLILREAKKNNYAGIYGSLIFACGLSKAAEYVIPFLESELCDYSDYLVFSLACAKSCVLYGESKAWVDLLKKWTNEPPLGLSHPSFFYNLANALSNQGEWEDANKAFHEAISSSPFYEEKGYFWSEYGASMFATGDYSSAAVKYKKALALNYDNGTSWRLSDALFRSGQVREAYAILEEDRLNPESDSAPYPELLRNLLRELTKTWNINKFDPAYSFSTEDYGNTKNAESESIDAIRFIAKLSEHLSHNPIDPLMNFNYGLTAMKMGMYTVASYRFLTCALLQSPDIEAWANAYICSVYAKEISQAICISDCAISKVHNGFIEYLMEFARSQPEGSNFSDIVNMLISQQKEERKSRDYTPKMTLRIHGDDDIYHERLLSQLTHNHQSQTTIHDEH